MPRVFNARVAGIQGEYQERDNETQYENVSLRVEIQAKYQEIAALQKYYLGYLAKEDKNICIRIIATKK